MTHEILNIDVDRLFADLQLSEQDMRRIGSLGIPGQICVPSLSAIKTDTAGAAHDIVLPGERFAVFGVKAPSNVPEQPLGQQAIDGVCNRTYNGIGLRERIAPGEAERVAWFAFENGLFRVPSRQQYTVAQHRPEERSMQFTNDADLSTEFDPDAEYEDRAVAVVRIPGYPLVVQVSPKSEAVLFPKAAVLAAHDADGGFAEHTAGSMLAEMGIVQDKQNPHVELTADRPGGRLTRQDQMARAMIRALMRLMPQN